MEYYKFNYDFIDLNGFVGEMDKNSKYYGLNEFKLGFRANILEEIGEFDLVFNKFLYNKLAGNGKLRDIFKKY